MLPFTWPWQWPTRIVLLWPLFTYKFYFLTIFITLPLKFIFCVNNKELNLKWLNDNIIIWNHMVKFPVAAPFIWNHFNYQELWNPVTLLNLNWITFFHLTQVFFSVVFSLGYLNVDSPLFILNFPHLYYNIISNMHAN